MKAFKRLLTVFLLLTLVGVIGLGVYLLAPPLSVRIADSPQASPIALVADNRNGGKRCLSDKAYCFDASYCDPEFTIDPHCAGLQRRLLDASEANDVAAAKLAVAEGANVNGPGLPIGGDWWIKAIHPSVFKGNAAMVRFLLDNGADVNDVYVCCMSAKTPLMEAVSGNHLEIAELLIARGANVRFKGIEDCTALRLAEQDGNDRMITLLDRAGAMSWGHRAETRLIRLTRRDPRQHRYKFPA